MRKLRPTKVKQLGQSGTAGGEAGVLESEPRQSGSSAYVLAPHLWNIHSVTVMQDDVCFQTSISTLLTDEGFPGLRFL